MKLHRIQICIPTTMVQRLQYSTNTPFLALLKKKRRSFSPFSCFSSHLFRCYPCHQKKGQEGRSMSTTYPCNQGKDDHRDIVDGNQLLFHDMMHSSSSSIDDEDRGHALHDQQQGKPKEEEEEGASCESHCRCHFSSPNSSSSGKEKLDHDDLEAANGEDEDEDGGNFQHDDAATPSQLFHDLFQRLHISASDWQNYDRLSPLINAQPCVESHHYTALGDGVIGKYISQMIFDYCTFYSLVLSVNAIQSIQAVWHNPFTLRYIAEKKLGFLELQRSRSQMMMEENCETRNNNGVSGENNKETKAKAAALRRATKLLQSLEHVEKSPFVYPHNVRGTSFEFHPHGFAQSSFAPRLSHFIGCVVLEFGEEKATEVVKCLFQMLHLDEGTAQPGTKEKRRSHDAIVVLNLPQKTAKLLLQLVEEYSLPNVALSVLAMQGIPVQFTTRSVMGMKFSSSGSEREDSQGPPSQDGFQEEKETGNLHTFAAEEEAQQGGRQGETMKNSCFSSSSSSTLTRNSTPQKNIKSSEEMVGNVKVDHEDGEHSGPIYAKPSVSLNDALQSLAAGSTVQRAADRWKEKAKRSVVPQKGDEHEGWIPEQERRTPATEGQILDLYDTSIYSADRIGDPEPQQGKYIHLRPGEGKPVHDPLLAPSLRPDVNKNGIEIDTFGLDVKEFIDSYSQPHARKFEVTAKKVILPSQAGKEQQEGPVLGKAIANSYTEGRVLACTSILRGIVADLQKIQESSVSPFSSEMP